MARYLYSELSRLIQARSGLLKKTDTREWIDKHEDMIETLVKDHMPSGSGFDAGTKLDLERSHADKLVFTTGFHHMNDGGFYDGWTEHEVHVTPSLASNYHMRITGRDRRDIKDYIYQSFDHAIQTDVEFDVIEVIRERVGVKLESRWLDQSRLAFDVSAPNTDTKTFSSEDKSEYYQGSPLERARAYAVQLAHKLARV